MISYLRLLLNRSYLDFGDKWIFKISGLMIVIGLGVLAPWLGAMLGWKPLDNAGLVLVLGGVVLMIVGSMVNSSRKIHDEQKSNIESIESAYSEDQFLAAKSKYEADLAQLETIANNFGHPPRVAFSLEHKFYLGGKHRIEAEKHLKVKLEQMCLDIDPHEVWDIKRAGGLNRLTIEGTSYDPNRTPQATI